MQETINHIMHRIGNYFLLIFLLLISGSCNQINVAFKKGVRIIDFKTLSFDKPVINFGDSSDIVIPNSPTNLISVSYVAKDQSFIWNLNTPAYIQINHINPNKINCDTVASILVASQEFLISEFDAEVKKINKHFDIPLIKPDDQNYLQLDKLLFSIHGQAQPNGIKSIYSKEQHSFILLDTIVKLKSKTGRICSFRSNGTVKSTSLTLAFFNPLFYSLFPTVATKDFLRNEDTSFHVKITSLYSNWGASIFTINHIQKRESDSFVVTFNKPYRFAFSNEELQSKLKSNNALPINITQEYQSSFLTNDLIIPNFSFTKSGSLGQISSFDNIQIYNVLSKSSNPCFIYYLVPLLIVFLILFSLFFWHKKTAFASFLHTNLYIPESQGNEKTSWKNHFAWLSTVLFILLGYRIFIAYQLSYTNPYFTYAFPIAVIISPLILIAVYSSWSSNALRYSLKLSPAKEQELKKKRGVNALIILMLTIVVLVWCYCLPEVKYFLQGNKDFNFSFKILKSEVGPLVVVLTVVIAFILNDGIAWVTSIKSFGALNQIMKSLSWFSLPFWSLLFLIIAIFVDNAYSALLLIALLLGQYWAFTNLWGNNYRKKLLDKLSAKEGWVYKILYRICEKFTYLIIRSFSLIIIAYFFAASIKKDPGYLINLFFIPLAIIFVFIFNSKELHWSTERKKRVRGIFYSLVFSILITGILFIWGAWCIKSENATVETFSNRTYSRLTTFYDFKKVEQAGYKNSEGFAQFFAILSKYSKPNGANGNSNFFHPAISNYSDPIVLNDLSFPAAGIAPWGPYYIFTILILVVLWFLLLRTVLLRTLFPYKLNDEPNRHSHYNFVTDFGIIRVICVTYLVGSGLWLIASYYGLVPFTGRLIFALGQDSVAEVLETVILFAGMGLIYHNNKSSHSLKMKNDE